MSVNTKMAVCASVKCQSLISFPPEHVHGLLSVPGTPARPGRALPLLPPVALNLGFVYILLQGGCISLEVEPSLLPVCFILSAWDIIGAQKMFVVVCLFKVRAIIHKIHTSHILW